MLRSSFAALSLATSMLLTGCALNTTATPSEEQGLAIQGRVQGGQQPVVGAKVYLLAANTTGYPTATTNASKSLMKFVSGKTSLDIASGPTNGFYYVTTDTNGNFSIGGDYTCVSGQQAYLYAVGGDAGAGVNSAAGFLAVLGNCPSAGNFATTVPFIYVNEVTTVASAYAMSGFEYDALHVSSPNATLSKRNIQNAFGNANNVVDITSGTAYVNLPAGNGAGAPNSINTLANILASCVNSTGPTSTNCATLFTLAKTNGTTGTAPTDTATAAMNIAHNQGSNVAALFTLLGPVQAFNPSYTTAPADFTIPIRFTSPELGGVNSVAIDAFGDVWLATSAATSSFPSSVNGFSEFSPQGVHLTTVTDPTNFTSSPSNILVDTQGYIYASVSTHFVSYVPGAANAQTSSTPGYPITDFVESGNTLDYTAFRNGSYYLNATVAPGTNDLGPGPLALDGNGNFWAAYRTSGTLVGWNSNQLRITPATAGYSVGSTPLGVAIDQANNIWVGATSSTGGGQATRINSAGTVLATFTDPNMSAGGAVVVDGANNVFFFGGGTDTIVELDSQGNQLQTFGRITSYSNEHYVALDGSGNAWVLSGGGGVYQLLGIATPVVTPLPANLVSPYTTPASKPQ